MTERLPRSKRDDIRKAMRAAYRLSVKEGMARLETLACWLERDGQPDAAASLREGLAETFTINRLELPGELCRCLATTNLLESPHAGVRSRTRRVTHWSDAQMVLRWSAAALLQQEKQFRRLDGYRHLWILDSKLQELAQTAPLNRVA